MFLHGLSCAETGVPRWKERTPFSRVCSFARRTRMQCREGLFAGAEEFRDSGLRIYFPSEGGRYI